MSRDRLGKRCLSAQRQALSAVGTMLGDEKVAILPAASIRRRYRILFYTHHAEVHAHPNVHPADKHRDRLARISGGLLSVEQNGYVCTDG
jgi:hypothetical protein